MIPAPRPARAIPFHYAVLAVVALFGFLAWLDLDTPSIAPATVPPASPADASPEPWPTYPRELIALAVAEATTMAALLPPTPTAEPATRVPDEICISGATEPNTVCVMPPELLPTSTPLPECSADIDHDKRCLYVGPWATPATGSKR